MKVSIVKGATSVLLRIFIQDSSSTTGAGLAGLAFNTAGLTCYRMRDDDGNAGATAISLATATLGTWATGGFKEKDATNAPGWYEFGITNAAIATGSRTAGIHFKGATNMAPLPIEIELTGWDNQDAVRGGMTALPNAAAEAAGGLYTRGTGAGQIAQDANGNVRVNVDTIKTNPVVNGGTITFPTTATLASTTNIAAATGIDVTKWLGGTIPAVNVTGVPLVDAKYLLGTIFPTPTVAGVPNVNVKTINDVATTPVTTVKAVQGLAVDGVIVTATNLTNAPTAGDFTATMKTSIGTAVAASAVASVTARVTANTDQIAGSANAASNLARGTLATVLGTVGSASSTTSIVTSALDPAAAAIDQFKGRIVTFDRATTTANLRGQATDITGNTALGVLTVTALTDAPVSGDTFTIT